MFDSIKSFSNISWVFRNRDPRFLIHKFLIPLAECTTVPAADGRRGQTGSAWPVTTGSAGQAGHRQPSMPSVSRLAL